MEEEKILEAIIFDELVRGVRYYHQNRELKSIEEIAKKILQYDIHLITDISFANPKSIN